MHTCAWKESWLTATIKDIARIAGVSHSTVSRALHGHPGIPEDTTVRIKAVAAELGYVPSAVARGLKTSRSLALGVIVTRIDDPFFSEVLQGIEDGLREMGYSLFVAASNRSFEREKTIVQAMRARRVDGVIICSTQFNEDHYLQFRRYGFPIVVVGNQEISGYEPMIVHDDLDGSSQVARHLLALGHTKIAFLGNARAPRTTQVRFQGVCSALRSAGLPIPERYIFHSPNGRPDGGEAGVRRFLDLPDPPSAIVCFNDMVAIGVLKSLRDTGVAVPAQCSVTGFDDIPLAAYACPPLTTFQQPKYQLGYQAAQLMVQLLHAQVEDTPLHGNPLILHGKLVLRGSTAPV
jgi:LacI family transcriptional regulator, repressor for deo operon, udp, cdd, tsx, nupC, and nupG